MGPAPAARRARSVVLIAALAVAAACGSSDGSSGARGTDPTTAKRSVVDRTLPASACPTPTTPPRQATTTALATNGWPPLGYDRSALVHADLLSWKGGRAVVRWSPGQGVEVCTASLTADVAWVLDAGGYTELRGQAIGDFVTRREADLGATADGIPFQVEVSDDGTRALQLAEVPPG